MDAEYGAGLDGVLAEIDRRSQTAREVVTDEARRDHLRSLVDPFRALASPTSPVTTAIVARDGWTEHDLVLEVLEGVRFSVRMLVPDGLDRAAPTVIAVHGHGYGGRQILGLDPTGTGPGEPADLYGAFAVQLVRRGLVVLVPDVAGFGDRITPGDRRYDPDAGSGCYRWSMNLLMHGLTLTGLRVTELLGVLDLAVGLPEVDADRIGVMGHSGGALWSMVTAALDPRIRAAVLSGFPNTFATSVLAVPHCVCNVLPGVLPIAELPDLLALIAPRPLFCESGADDPIFPAAGFDRSVSALRGTYDDLGVPDRLDADLVPGVGHAVTGRRSYDWLVTQLTR